MAIEDERGFVMRSYEKVQSRENKLSEEIKKLKLEQEKLSCDIEEFAGIKDQFEKQRQSKMSEFAFMKQKLHDKFNSMDEDLKLKE